jgi:hypothetical protein
MTAGIASLTARPAWKALELGHDSSTNNLIRRYRMRKDAVR